MRPRHGGVVRVALADQHVAVEAREVGDTEDADAAERVRVRIQNLALGDIRLQAVAARALQPEDRGRAGLERAFQRAPGDVRLFVRLHQTVHDELILDAASLAEVARGGVAAVGTP